MKRKNYKRKLISFIVIWSVVLSSLLFSSPDNIVVLASADTEIQLVSPEQGAVFNAPTVEIIGSISDELTLANNLLIKVFEQIDASLQPIDITGDGKLTIVPQEKYADFTFSKEYSEGTHKITFVVTNEDGVSAKVDQTFTVESASAEPANNSSAASDNGTAAPLQPSPEESGTSQNSTSTTAASQVSSKVTDTSQLTVEEVSRPYMAHMYLIPKGSENKYEPGKEVPSSFLPAEDMTRVPLDYMILIDVRSKEPLTKTQPLLTSFGNFTGKEDLVKTTLLTDNLTSYVYTFTPDKSFTFKTSYYVYVSPKFSSESGNEIIPRFLKFTTVSQYEEYQFQADKGDNGKDYRDNDYIHGPYSVVTNACAFCHSTHNGTNDFLISGEKGSTENELCMACHDGTGAPKIEGDNIHRKHYLDDSVSCSSCHDPHNPGTKENPNSLHSISVPDNNGSHFMAYNKASSAVGNADDFSLCLSCHNGKEDTISQKQITDIEKYYKEATFIGQSGHNIKASDDSGSSLNGQLPCAECHETHGSENLKMLRSELGNIKLADDSKKYISSGDTWNAANERDFCLKCHNQSTIIYGKTALFKEKDDLDQPIIGHRLDEDKDVSCSSCHGGQSKSFIEAAHSPGKLSK
ncbi:cytochrome c3 family protein [Bacillus sp. sid0103]|uniref:cytochrome c3 family protein n=1 Tax=Bacillus sp. sid0103 TaxID=2856337 RepID=UPI001C472DFD|nr:cytochrome c3 family protein [Bacillus sp. sid0103]MBV7505746.1 cytochrome c3 family protein [Bacillus sp. sid0103]